VRVTRQVVAVVAVGGAAWTITAIVTLAAVFAVFFLVQLGQGASHTVRVSLALLLLIAPAVAGAVALAGSLIWLREKCGANRTASVLFACVCCGVSLFALGQIVSAFNQCALDVSLPFPWVKPCR
jgi:hypothetical protein